MRSQDFINIVEREETEKKEICMDIETLKTLTIGEIREKTEQYNIIKKQENTGCL